MTKNNSYLVTKLPPLPKPSFIYDDPNQDGLFDIVVHYYTAEQMRAYASLALQWNQKGKA